MDDLTKCLYKFACAKRMGNLYEDEEYQETLKGIEQQKERVAAYLDQAQQRELRLLLEDITSKGDIEGEHLFQAALSLSRELYGLVRA